MFRYRVYGIAVESETPLSLVADSEGGEAAVTLAPAHAATFAEALGATPSLESPASWYRIAHLADGSVYVRWEEWFHFLISGDGRRVSHALLATAPTESLHAYLLSQVLSYALVKMGHEPLHVTSVVAQGRAIGFMGSSGLGKSTLAACMLADGCRLLTDDLLVVSPDTGLAQPGPPRIKLFPEVAELFIGAGQPATPMNPASEKLIVPLASDRCCEIPSAMRRIYVLAEPDAAETDPSPRVERLSEQDAFLELLAGTFNARIRTPARLKRQFDCFTRLVRLIPIKRLVYRRALAQISAVRELVLADMAMP